MTHTSTEQPEALRLAEIWQAKAQREASRQNSAYDVFGMGNTPESVDPLGASMAAELRSLHARVQELEASQAQRVPLSEPITHVAYRPTWDGETWAMTQIVPMNSIKVDQLKTHWVTHRDFSDDPFTAGLRYAERAHGITQEKQG